MIRVSLVIARPAGDNPDWSKLVAAAIIQLREERYIKYDDEVELYQLHYDSQSLQHLPPNVKAVTVKRDGSFIMPEFKGEHVFCVLAGRSVVTAWAMARLAADYHAQCWTFDDKLKYCALRPVLRVNPDSCPKPAQNGKQRYAKVGAR